MDNNTRKNLLSFLVIVLIVIVIYLHEESSSDTDSGDNTSINSKSTIPSFRAQPVPLRNICFHTNQASERGTEIALYDYADYIQVFYGIKAIMLFPNISNIVHGMAYTRFTEKFPIVLYNVEPQDIQVGGQNMIQKALQEAHCQFIYIIKAGAKESFPTYDNTVAISPIPIGIHAVFDYEEHGATYAGISCDVTKSAPTRPIVSHIVRPVNLTQFHALSDHRKAWNISSEAAIVLCRYGALDTFDVPFVHEWIWQTVLHQAVETSKHHPEVHFVFMNTNPFPTPAPLNSTNSTNTNSTSTSTDSDTAAAVAAGVAARAESYLHYIPGTTKHEEKEAFLRSCDGMIHAREMGESFGLSIAEFSSHNLPVLTYAPPNNASLEHVHILGEKGFVFKNEEELRTKTFPQFLSVLKQLKHHHKHHKHSMLHHTEAMEMDFNAYRPFAPEIVMKQFVKVFLTPVFGEIREISQP